MHVHPVRAAAIVAELSADYMHTYDSRLWRADLYCQIISKSSQLKRKFEQRVPVQLEVLEHSIYHCGHNDHSLQIPSNSNLPSTWSRDSTTLSEGSCHTSMDYSNIPLQDIPGAPAPPGQTSNVVDPESRGRLTIVVCSTFMSLVIAFVTLRVYSRLWLARSFTKDDCKLLRHQSF